MARRRATLLTLFMSSLIGMASMASASNGTLRLSWDHCDPVVPLKHFAGAGANQQETLVLSVIGCDVPNNGNRVQVTIYPVSGDAWRFDKGGCQEGRLDIEFAGLGPDCPAFIGENPLPLQQYSYDSYGQRAVLDVANAYDDFHPLADERYTLWQAVFDHSYSSDSGGDPALTCQGADSEVVFYHFAYSLGELLLLDGSKEPFSAVESSCVFWNRIFDPSFIGSNPCTVQALPTTWGRIKSFYR
jgi:hypothetical protein